ncbi:MAG TPA: hypothetical protein VMW27_25240 [Thermoanaerobaculia bacterium]|nr:hypothetical protein [Thermoanaerobaculia bacterium]
MMRKSVQRPPIWLLLAGALACLLYFATERWLLAGDLGFPLDDSWIHLQFARNLAEGRGLSYNPGELVTGSTAPLWTALLALLFALPGSVVVWTKLLGVVLYLAGIDATWRLARELDLPRGLAALAAGLTLSTSWLVWSALSGMEVPLFVLLSLWGLLLHLRERHAPTAPTRPPLSLGLLAVSALARPEGLLLLALAFADRCLTFDRPSGEGEDGGGALVWRRPSWKGLAAGALLAVCALAGALLFYRWAGGSFLPTTFAAKGGDDVRRLLPNLQYLHTVLGIFFGPQPWMTLAAGAGVVVLVERLGTRRDHGLLPALWLLGLPLAYSLISKAGRGAILGNFGRYYFPLFPVLVVLGVLGLERAARALGPRLVRLSLAALLALLILWPTVANLVRGAGRYAQNVRNVQDSDVRIARWLAPRLPPEAVLAVNDIGAIKYFLPNRIVDLVGIASPELRRETRDAVRAGAGWDQALADAVARRQPDYLVVFPTWVPGLVRQPGYRPVSSLTIPSNITMGGNEIVVYETPWTRYRLRAVQSP